MNEIILQIFVLKLRQESIFNYNNYNLQSMPAYAGKQSYLLTLMNALGR